MKKCPFCSEEIQSDAIKCRYCGEFIVDKEIEVREKTTIGKKEKKKGGGAWYILPVVFLGVIAFNIFPNLYENAKKKFTKDPKGSYYCLNKSSGVAYKVANGTCGKNKKITKLQYINSSSKKENEKTIYCLNLDNGEIRKETMLTSCNGDYNISKEDYFDIKTTRKTWQQIVYNPSNSKYCLYSNGSKFSNSHDCKINGKTIISISKKDFLDLEGDKVDWEDVFIRNGGDPSKIYINDKKTEKQIIDESQKKILEELQNNNRATNDLKDTIRRTRDIKTLACILGGNLNLLNIIEFIEDCY